MSREIDELKECCAWPRTLEKVVTHEPMCCSDAASMFQFPPQVGPRTERYHEDDGGPHGRIPCRCSGFGEHIRGAPCLSNRKCN